MTRIIVFLSSIFVISLCSLDESFYENLRDKRQNNEVFKCGIQYSVTGLISGGNQVRHGEFPWLVAILKRTDGSFHNYICSGTLISSTKVVTAAHCIHDKYSDASPPRDFLLLFGAYNLNESYETERIVKSPSDVIVHNGWNPSNDRFTDDIAILVLERGILFSNYIRPVCLMSHDFGITDGVVAAWGKDDKSHRIHENIPKKLEIPITLNENCYRVNSKLADISWPRSFCAGQPGVGVCKGDSGGGFFVKLNNKFYFKGLVSCGNSELGTQTGCFTENFVIYTDVVKYHDFISDRKQSCGVMSSEASLVVGGRFSSREQFPWLVSIFYKTDFNTFMHRGSGSLITNRHVLSLAKAVAYHNGRSFYRPEPTDSIIFYFGSSKYDSSDEPGAIKVEGVQKISVYPQAQHVPPYMFNIAVTTMKQPITFSLVIYPICLRKFNERNEAGFVAFGVGYAWDQTRNDTGVKKHVRMTIDSHERCQDEWSYEMNLGYASRYFCATGTRGNAPYGGDDPLYMKIDGKWFLRGMISMSATFKDNGHLNTEAPIFYEDISMFIDWIGRITNMSV